MHLTAASFVSLLLLAPSIDGWLGIYLDNDRAEAAVVEVIPDSPAAKAGLQPGDVLLAVGDKPTATREAFIATVRAAKPGDAIALKVRRDGQERVLQVTLGSRPEAAAAPTQPAPRPARPERPVPTAEIAPAVPAEARGYLGLSVREADGGVSIDRVLADGPAAAARLKPGERIVKIGDRTVRTLADLDVALQGSGPGKPLVFQLRDDGGERTVTLRMGVRPADATAPDSRPSPGPAPAPAPQRASRQDGPTDVEAELGALRAELAELRKQLEDLRRNLRRE